MVYHNGVKMLQIMFIQVKIVIIIVTTSVCHNANTGGVNPVAGCVHKSVVYKMSGLVSHVRPEVLHRVEVRRLLNVPAKPALRDPTEVSARLAALEPTKSAPEV
jgi:hypothetical protein